MRHFLFTLILFFGFFVVDAQSLRQEYAFVNHLMNQENFDDALFIMNKFDTKMLSPDFLDTINYLKGWANYRLKELETSSSFLEKVSDKSPFYQKSVFFSAYNQTYLANYNYADSLLLKLDLQTKEKQEVRSFQKAGIALLSRDYESYELLRKDFTYGYFPITNEEKKLDEYYKAMQAFKPKSMFAAGVLSAIVPGLGKIYAGRIGEGVASFTTVGVFGAVAYENYRKEGLKNWKTITFGSIASVFYIGNIYGSVFSVKVYRQEFYESVDHNILFNLHIPLRTIFN